MLAVRNFFSTSHLCFSSRTNQVSLFIFICFFIVITFLIWYKSSCLNFIVVQVTVTSEDVFWSIRNAKFINESFYNMRCLVMFITAICLIFLIIHSTQYHIKYLNRAILANLQRRPMKFGRLVALQATHLQLYKILFPWQLTLFQSPPT